MNGPESPSPRPRGGLSGTPIYEQLREEADRLRAEYVGGPGIGRHRLVGHENDTEEIPTVASSQNGWRANDASVTSTRNVPGSAVRLRVRNGAAGDLLLEVAARFDREVENIDDVADDWGYGERTIRGSTTTLSNHASGTAIDLNATRHPLATDPSRNFSAEQIKAIRAIVATTGGVVRWGGDYTGRKDGMHFEINDGRTELDCSRALSRLRGVAPGGTASAPAASRLLKLTKPNMRGDDVAALQRAIGVADDGIFGPNTEKALKAFQTAHGLVADGIAGPKTFAAAHLG